jgi:alpha-tubulin suppressor-like RCC1 family protein
MSSQLGHGRNLKGKDGQVQYLPKRVEFLSGQIITSVAAGNLHSVALTEDGQVYTWGRAQSGRLGRLHEVDCVRDEFSPGLVDTNW